jgi:hypothetical protein
MTELWRHRYKLALRFASFFESSHRYDIVHDAWVYYMDKEGEDLFELTLKNESSYIYTVVKKAFYRWYYKERSSAKYQYFSNDGLVSKFDSPEEQLIGKDLYQLFYQKLFLATKPTDKRHYRTDKSRQLPMEIFRLKAEGYTQKEIADQLEVSKQLVGQYVKKIEEMANYTNPFNGSRTVIKNRVSQSAWNGRKDHSDFELEDENEYLKLYVHKESHEGWLVVVSNPKGSEFYIKRLETSENKD